MLFHITQVHTPEHCPKGAGGSNSLFDADAAGVTLVGRYTAPTPSTPCSTWSRPTT